MRYRDHRKGLDESMETVQDFYSVEEIKKYLNSIYEPLGEVAEIKFRYVCFDDRINWDTYYVLKRLNGSEQFTVAGYSDGTL